MVKAGVAVTIAGVVMMVAGGALYAASVSAQHSFCGGDNDFCGLDATLEELGAAILGGCGVFHLAVGIPLIAVGSQPVTSAPSAARSLIPLAPAAGSRSIGLTWAF